MNNVPPFPVSVSLIDSPIFHGFDYLFRGLKETGADGVEIVTGIKSRLHFKKILQLSEKHKLPITALHQPIWSGLPLYFDLDFVKAAKEIGVTKFVFHPLPNYSFEDKKMKEYLKKLANLQEKYGITIMLENMPVASQPSLIDTFFQYQPDTSNFQNIVSVAKEYNFQLTLDISHANVIEPQKETWFDEVFSRLANIHLSSFEGITEHLPLHLGKFNAPSFIEELHKRNYSGLITFEIFYPRPITLRSYDFESIKKSVEIVKNVL